MSLPFTRDEFLDVFAAYNEALWPLIIALWLLTAVASMFLWRSVRNQSRAISVVLALHWAWAAAAYHAAFLWLINPAAPLFAALFLCESALIVWYGVIHQKLSFGSASGAGFVAGTVFVTYGLLYPAIAWADGFVYPWLPTFGVPCPTTILFVGFLLAADTPVPRAVMAVPIIWSAIGGSAAFVWCPRGFHVACCRLDTGDICGDGSSSEGATIMSLMVATLLAIALVIGSGLLPIIAGRRRFDRLVADDVRALFADAIAAVGPDHLRARWDTLPEPIRRYLRYAINDGTPAIRTARLHHDGLFRAKPQQRWMHIEGEQYFAVATPGFVWNATVRIAPLFWIEARDRLLSGRGNMLVKVLSTFTIADARSAEIDQGASLRWLAECAWFPYAFAVDFIAWEPIDRRRSRATLRHQRLPVSAVLEVDDDGRLVELRADRYADIGGGKAVLRPWMGRYEDYRDFNGLRVPTSVEVSWQLGPDRFSYARFRVTALDYNVTLGGRGTS